MSGFLNREIAAIDDEAARVMEITQARAERDLYKAQYDNLMVLLRNYAIQIVDLQVRVALMELERNGG